MHTDTHARTHTHTRPCTLQAAKITVEPYWPGLFTKLFAKKKMDDLITNVGAGEPSPAQTHTDTSGTRTPVNRRGKSANYINCSNSKMNLIALKLLLLACKI